MRLCGLPRIVEGDHTIAETPGERAGRRRRVLEHLLLQACRPPRGRIEGLADATPADWRALARAAEAHGLVPAVHALLAGKEWAGVPDETQSALKDAYRLHVVRSLALARELVRLLALFDHAGLRVLPLKGPALACQVYGAPEARQAGDLDLLVAPTDERASLDLLGTHGFGSELAGLTDRQRRLEESFRHHLALVHERSGLRVELHTAASPPRLGVRFDFEALWSARSVTTFGSRTLPVLSPEHTLLTLCAHATSHGWWRLSWLLDIAQLLRHPRELDWECAAAAMGPARVSRMVHVGLLLVWHLMEAPLPRGVVAAASADTPAAGTVARVLSRGFADDQAPSDRAALVPFHLPVIERGRDKVVYLADVALKPSTEDYDLVALPDALLPAYFLVRPPRLALKHGRRVLGRRARGATGRG